MATRGCRGVVRAKLDTSTGSAVAIGSLTDWSYSEQADELDSSVMGACAVSAEAGAVKTSLDISAFWDPTDSTQGIFVIGSKYVMEIYPGGTTTGLVFYRTDSNGATLLSNSISANGVNGIVGRSMTLTVNGSLTATTVA